MFDFKGEIWKDIENYEDIYQVSNLGRVKSLRRQDALGRSVKERILKLVLSSNYYFNVSLHKNKERKSVLIHRLVAEAFIFNLESKLCVNHKDGNKLNNVVDNLEWCTHKENIDYSLIKSGQKRVEVGGIGKVGVKVIEEQTDCVKVCTKCYKKLSTSCFDKDKYKKDGLRSSCKNCKVKTDRDYICRNRKKVLLKKAEYRGSHREELAFKEKMRIKNFSDDERIEHNKKKVAYLRENPKQRQETVAVDFANRKAKKLGIEGKLYVKQWRDLKKKYSYICLYCKQQEPEISLTIDHIIPFFKGGLNTIENIQPLCGYCNKSKGIKIEKFGVIKSKVK